MTRYSQFDGSGRTPREAQTYALNWISANWSSKVLALNLPTGVGKSAILRALQLEYGAVGMVPTNILMDQYLTIYPTLNYVKGIEHYQCTKDKEYSCGDIKDIGNPPCKDCPYLTSKSRARNGESTVFNPISYYYFSKSDKFKVPKVLVIDEAHKLVEMIMLLTGISFRKSKVKYPKITNELELMKWLKRMIQSSYAEKELAKTQGNVKKALQLIKEITKIERVVQAFEKNPQEFVFYTDKQTYRDKEDEYLYIKPISPPLWLINDLLKADKIVLMSATLLETDLWDLGLKDYKYLDVISPIPKKNRQVLLSAHTEDMTYKTSEASVVKYINSVIDRFPNRNTIVHVSYSWAKRLKKYFPDAFNHLPEEKTATLKAFKEKGGLWIAGGCAEGIDLPGKECELNIIPFIVRSNPKDKLVEKQLALPNGWLKYNLDSLKTVIQQAGRSTRGIDDYSITVIGDNKFPLLYSKVKKYIPKSFSEAIVWNGRQYKESK